MRSSSSEIALGTPPDWVGGQFASPIRASRKFALDQSEHRVFDAFVNLWIRLDGMALAA